MNISEGSECGGAFVVGDTFDCNFIMPAYGGGGGIKQCCDPSIALPVPSVCLSYPPKKPCNQQRYRRYGDVNLAARLQQGVIYS